MSLEKVYLKKHVFDLDIITNVHIRHDKKDGYYCVVEITRANQISEIEVEDAIEDIQSAIRNAQSRAELYFGGTHK